MSGFDQQWQRLTAAARRAPERPLPPPPSLDDLRRRPAPVTIPAWLALWCGLRARVLAVAAVGVYLAAFSLVPAAWSAPATVAQTFTVPAPPLPPQLSLSLPKPPAVPSAVAVFAFIFPTENTP